MKTIQQEEQEELNNFLHSINQQEEKSKQELKKIVLEKVMEYTKNEEFVKYIENAYIKLVIRYISTKTKDVLEIENVDFYSDNNNIDKSSFLEIGSWKLDKNQQQNLKYLDINTVSRTTIQYSATDTFSSKPIDDHLVNISKTKSDDYSSNISKTTIAIKTQSYTVFDAVDNYSEGLYYKTSTPDTHYPRHMGDTIETYSPAPESDIQHIIEVINSGMDLNISS